MLLTTAALLFSTGAMQAETPAPPKPERRICKRTVDTGSLVRGQKECRTRSEWDRIAEAARAGGQDIVDRGAGGIVNN